MESSNSSSDALTTTLCNSIQALGRGFDVTSDIRLLYCKGAHHGSRLVQINEAQTQDLVLLDGLVLPNISVDIDCYCDKPTIEKVAVYTFHEGPRFISPNELNESGDIQATVKQDVFLLISSKVAAIAISPVHELLMIMAEYFNKKSGISGNIPLGSFNSMFNFTGSWQVDAAVTKSLAMVGYLIPLYKVKLEKQNLVLHEEVKRAVPYTWDPASLASFIENFGTHVVTSATIGGRDVVYIRQHQSSPLLATDIENYVKDMGDHRFQDSTSQSSAGPLKYKDKDVTVIFRRRGGDDLEQSHAKWAETVRFAPDVINMTFTPIVSLLEGVPGIKHLARAIDLYLEYKPPIEDLQYFLDFQIARVWAPEQNNLQRKEPVCQSLQFSLMGPKLYVSPDQGFCGAGARGGVGEGVGGVGNICKRKAETCIKKKSPAAYRMQFLIYELMPSKKRVLSYLVIKRKMSKRKPETSIKHKSSAAYNMQILIHKLMPRSFSSLNAWVRIVTTTLAGVTVGRKPVTGLRLGLEGGKQNRLSIHLQHLVSLPKILQPHWDAHVAIGAPRWQGPEEQDSRWFEPIKWKNFSHVSTAPIEYTETSIGDLSGVHIVTGAQLGVWDFGTKNVLHLKLLFSKVPGCTLRRSVWDHNPSAPSSAQKPDGSSSSNVNNRPPDDKKEDSSTQTGKLAKIIDMTEMLKGPQDIPGHWLVTGAKLGIDKGKIVVRVKYSLLNY
ncbi:hypothetical protein TIFTF001_012652 [Ficus carica]|uniref:MACPF domain-containing protein n=1 Tax=Ficus carica TaxID=3494 RepID=A0AA88D227_FICCA|nr:hypothetical protein TIFTF001_012652 [Ficus carica]